MASAVPREIIDSWLHAVYGRGFDRPRPDVAARLLAQHPALASIDAYLARAAGNEEMVRAAIAEKSEWVRTPGGPMKILPSLRRDVLRSLAGLRIPASLG
ncbi:MAG TPA: hypothetical protein VN736_06520 [Candidatus Limnocylindrales bacterium]|nr:hypothetical protein [Candidatus Limnocylindrales bacterium]